ncbi:MAG: M48 family metallopeptidase [Eubacteriales bacterium]|nr:M48 family metallopeptidase [Eubacteriales bacterium]
MEYTLIRSSRRTAAIQIKGAEVVVRAPYLMSASHIERFVSEHEDWIKKHLEKAAIRKAEANALPKLNQEDIRALAAEAMRVIPERVKYYAPLVGVSYGRITIRNQRTRWGSCSKKGNLNFNCLLMLTPPEVIDSVVVHELCHRKVMNHSDRFYAEVLKVYPDYKKWDKWLKKNGAAIMARMTGD